MQLESMAIVLSISFEVDGQSLKVGEGVRCECQRRKLRRGGWGHPPGKFEI